MIWFSLPASFCPKHPQSQLLLEVDWTNKDKYLFQYFPTAYGTSTLCKTPSFTLILSHLHLCQSSQLWQYSYKEDKDIQTNKDYSRSVIFPLFVMAYTNQKIIRFNINFTQPLVIPNKTLHRLIVLLWNLSITAKENRNTCNDDREAEWENQGWCAHDVEGTIPSPDAIE